MIKANELRIGNIVFELENVKVESIGSTGINADQLGADIPFDMLTGIPLTYGIMLHAGFKVGNAGYEWGRKDIDSHVELWWDNVEGLSIQTKASGWSWKQPGIKHLHQLQNLYVALTGEELTVNL